MGGIFICYRREDTAGWAGRLESDLQAGLGGVFIFRDVEDIPPGVKYDEYISQALGSCDVLIALIGPQWLTAKDGQGIRRLDDPNDFIALEIATCLRRDIRVIPALVGGARIPVGDELPPNIRELSRRQAYELSDSRWTADCRKLITDIAPLVRARPKIRREHLAAAAATLVVAAGGYGLWQWYTATSTTQGASARLTTADAGSTTPELVAGPRIVQREGGGNDGSPARNGQSSAEVADRPELPQKNPTRTSSAVAPSPGSTDPKDAAQDLRRFVGEYDAGSVTIVVAIGKQGELIYTLSGAEPIALEPLGGLRFVAANPGNGLLPEWTVEFRLDASGEVIDFVSHQANGNPVAIRRETGLLDRSVLAVLAGTYDTGQFKVKVLLGSDGTLTYLVPGQPTHQLVWARKLHFAVKDAAGVSVEFRRGPDGRIEELVSHQLNGDYHARRSRDPGSLPARY